MKIRQVVHVFSSYWKGGIRVCVNEGDRNGALRQATAIANRLTNRRGRGCSVPFQAICQPGVARIEWGETFTPRPAKKDPQLRLRIREQKTP